MDSQEKSLVGVKLAHPFGRLHPYGDLLFGRGQIDYGREYTTPNRNAFCLQSFTNVFSPGVGVDFDVSPRISLKLDAQFQRYSTPVTPSAISTPSHLFLALSITSRSDEHDRFLWPDSPIFISAFSGQHKMWVIQNKTGRLLLRLGSNLRRDSFASECDDAQRPFCGVVSI